ncbi:ABC transporter ATP-binding protein [Actinokineospora sp. NBRC 105648]|uniref:ABC transporter ATP-binding protein n=1 Tax=Actinokineospora sp. NBRC 105648 TaxID=3032206 RepID=UPI002555C819|nr:ABC transporter ATP-binding protein [Actinokineospora sp. NBRC 105648]
MSAELEPRLPVASAAQVRAATRALLRADRRAVLLLVALTCAAALCGLAGPWLLGRIIDRVDAGTASTSVIDGLALAVVGFAVAQLLCTRFARLMAYRFGERALARLREEFVEQVLRLPTGAVERAGVGELTTRASVDVGTVGQTVRDAIPDFAVSIAHVVILYVAVFLLHPVLGLCAVVVLPVILLVTRWYLARARAAYLNQAMANSTVAESMTATGEGARTVEALGLADRRIADTDAAVATAYRTRSRTLALRSVLFPVVDFAHALPVALTLLVGGYGYLSGWLGLGSVIAAALYLWQLKDPVDQILFRLEQLQSSGAAMARLKGVGLVPPAPVGGLLPTDDRIEVRGARFAYVEGHDVLHGVDLTVQPGERLAIVGPSGAGKSTLGRLLSGVDEPRSGAVLVGGVPVSRLPPDELAKRIILVTQDHHVFIGTLRENLLLAAPSATDAQIAAALAAVEAEWWHTLPAGLDTHLGAGGVGLDAARSQQLALARVVLADPHTLVLDEATSLLDPTTARLTERALAAVLRGRTVIAIAHRLHTAHDADRVAVVEHGVITELDTHDNLVAANGRYAALWHSWHGDPV